MAQYKDDMERYTSTGSSITAAGVQGGIVEHSRVAGINIEHYHEAPSTEFPLSRKRKLECGQQMLKCSGTRKPCAAILEKNYNFCPLCKHKVNKAWFSEGEDPAAIQTDSAPRKRHKCSAKCSYTSDSSFEKCPKCGSMSEEYIPCPHNRQPCNKPVKDGSKFCEECGRTCQATSDGVCCLTPLAEDATCCPICGWDVPVTSRPSPQDVIRSVWKLANIEYEYYELRAQQVGVEQAFKRLRTNIIDLFESTAIDIASGSLVFTFLHDTKEQAQYMMANRTTVLTCIHDFLKELDANLVLDNVELCVQIKTKSGQVIDRCHECFSKVSPPGLQASHTPGPAGDVRSVYPNTVALAELRISDQPNHPDIAVETEAVSGDASGTLWRLTKVYDETAELQNSVEALEKETAKIETMIYLLSSADRQHKMKHLFSETEVLQLIDISFHGILSVYHLPTSSALEMIAVKQDSSADRDRDQRLETEDFMRLVLDQLKRGLEARRDLFPLLGYMMRHVKCSISHLQVKTDNLKQVDQLKRRTGTKRGLLKRFGNMLKKKVKGIIPSSKVKTDILKPAASEKDKSEDLENQTDPNPDVEHDKHVEQTDRGDECVPEESPNTVLEGTSSSHVTGENPGVTQINASGRTNAERIEELETKLATVKMEAERKKQELKEIPEATDHGVEWEYNMDCLSQNMAQLKIQDLITDVIGADEIPVTTDKPLSFLDIDRSTRIESHVHKLRKLQSGALTQRDLLAVIRDLLTDDQSRLTDLRTQSDQMEREYGSPHLHIVGELGSEKSGPVSCPAMTLDPDRVYERLSVSESGELVNGRGSGGDQRGGRLQRYWGTCSRLPIPLPPSPSTLTAHRYWETQSRIQMKDVSVDWYIQELGVCGEGKVDTRLRVAEQSGSSWSVRARVCTEHGDICTWVWGEGRRCGRCHRNNLSLTPGTGVHTIHWGVILDIGRGRLAFVDVTRGRVIHKFDVDIHESLRPMFGVTPYSNCDVKMKLLSGSEIAMDDRKKSLIAEALFSAANVS